MNDIREKKELCDRDKIKQFLIGLGFVSYSSPSAQHLIYSKNGDIVVIKNQKKE